VAAGYQSYTAFWVGGASSPATVAPNDGGYTSLLAPWLGGASAPPPLGGYTSLLAFWIGGASGFAGSTPPIIPPASGGGSVARFPQTRRHHLPQQQYERDYLAEQRIVEDREFLLLLRAMIAAKVI
jgi:hypothetical protein